MKHLLIILSCFFSSLSFGQENLIPLNSFYKDQLYSNKLKKPFNEGSFLPITEASYSLLNAIKDSSVQYYDFTEILFKKHLIEVKGDDFHIKISPAIDFGYGKDFEDTLERRLYQNTRGFYVEGNLFDNFAFSTSLFENQGRYTDYETDYYSSQGELYPSDTFYYTQNGVIPGGGRTKPFKEDGFDYAYAIGYFVYSPFQWLKVSAGNNPQFVGEGHRSVLLSDNSYSAPYLRTDWKIGDKLNFTYHRSRLMNLLRRPATGSVESYYEAKGFSVNYLTYKPKENLSISLFESGIWNRGDSVTSTSSHPMYYNPIPILSGLALKDKNEVVSLLGLNIGCQLLEHHRLYGQLGVYDYDGSKNAFQLGYRGYNFFNLNDFMIQLEYNQASNGMYRSDNPRLNYIHYNLPLAHSKGNGFQEYLIRANYEYKRAYVDFTAVYYHLKDYHYSDLLPIYRELDYKDQYIFYTTTELGYRFNRKMNLMLFVNWTLRTINDEMIPTANWVSGGLRTGFINHYKDF